MVQGASSGSGVFKPFEAKTLDSRVRGNDGQTQG